MYRNQLQQGQVGVVILLIMTVLLTVGLSIATRSTQDLFLSKQQAESARVFNAAEAGIEKALATTFDFEGNSLDGEVSTITDTDVNYTITKSSVLETRLFEGVTVKIDVDDSGAGTGLTVGGRGLIVDWSKENDCNNDNPASLLISIFYNDAGTTRVRYQAYSACERSDGFTLASTGSNPYLSQVTIPLNQGDLFARIKAVYNDTHVKVVGNNWTLPVQAFNIRSEANNENGNETRIVEVVKTLDTAPSLMDYAVFSGTTIVK